MDLTTLAYLLFAPASAVNLFAIAYVKHKNNKTKIYVNQLKDRLTELKEGVNEAQEEARSLKKKQVKQADITALEERLSEATAELLFIKKKVKAKNGR